MDNTSTLEFTRPTRSGIAPTMQHNGAIYSVTCVSYDYRTKLYTFKGVKIATINALECTYTQVYTTAVSFIANPRNVLIAIASALVIGIVLGIAL
jgi:hypothetical protein